MANKKLSAKKPTKMAQISIKEYAQTLADIKKKIQEAQIKASLAANKELLKLYWSIGEIIYNKQQYDGWGANTVEKLANDIQKMFPGITGFSRANIFRMQAFFLAYEKVAQPARQIEDLPIFRIPWFHNVILLQKLKNNTERLWYAEKAIENGWSRSMLELWIESDLYSRQGKAITNFRDKLPKPHSDIAHQTLKDPYLFDF